MLSVFHLNRRDLLDMEQRLHAGLSRVLRFSSHAVYFPQEAMPPEAVWITDESTLLIPLFQPETAPGEHEDAEPELLGVFAARGVDAPGEDSLRLLPGIAALCMENLLLYKLGRLDPVSGLAIRRVFEDRVSREITAIQNAFSGGDDMPAGGCFGIIAGRLAPLRAMSREYGQAFAETFTRRLAMAMADILPEGSLAARVGDTSFAVFLPGASRASCEETARAILAALDSVRLPAPLSGRETGIMALAGYALYPQDMDGLTAVREPKEQAQRLIQRAALAASIAARFGQNGARCMPYGRILHDGGMILRPLPLARLVVSLGRNAGAREGQRFAVHGLTEEGQAPLYKGELSLIKVYRDESEAEVIRLGEPGSPPVPGDLLSLLPDVDASVPDAPAGGMRDGGTGFLRHSDFLARLAQAEQDCERFALALVDVDSLTESPETLLASVASRLRDRFKLGDEGVRAFAGRYGHHSLMLFHANEAPEALKAAYETESADLSRSLECRIGVGLACWPFLQFRRTEMVDCARKALEYALLLPAPHVGVFDSLALNISADKRHCVGDLFGAMEEYKLALLADENNALAWNSLGVCMAALGRQAEARRHFEEAFARTPEDAALAYNLGGVCLDLGDVASAENYFQTCLGLDPAHVYAKIRQGQAAERRDDLAAAKERYQEACALENSGLAYRHLARLSLRAGDVTEAREHLHQALQRNPRDAVALQLMAGLYLDGGEDPRLAESLARHSVALHSERKHGWLTLARALDLQNRDNEAREARLRAGEL